MSDFVLLLIGAGIGLGMAATAALLKRAAERYIARAVAQAVTAEADKLRDEFMYEGALHGLGMAHDITQTRSSAPADSIRDRVLAEKELFTLAAQRELLTDIHKEINGKGDANRQ